ncbi:MAG: tetratricopeptide repeat protein, partial [Candidatus Thorarchaeota archaeon]
LEFINKAIQIEPDDKRLLVLKAINLLYLNKLKQVKKFIKKELGLNIFSKNTKIDTSALFMLIFSYLGRGKVEKALNIAKELSIQFPDHLISLLAEAMIQGYNLIYQFSEKESNRDVFEGIIDRIVNLEQIKFRKARIVQLKALILYGINDIEKADQEIDRAIELDKNSYEIAFKKINFLIDLEEHNKVITLIDKYLILYPQQEVSLSITKAFIYYFVGRNLELTHGNKEKAYEYYHLGLEVTNRVLEEYPNNVKSLNNKILYLAALNKSEEAIEAANNLITLYPDDGNHYDTYAQVLMQFEDYEEAIEMFRKAIDIDPNGFYVYISYNRMAECYKELGDYENALEAAEKSKEIFNKQIRGVQRIFEYSADKLAEEIKELLKEERKI